MVKHAKLNLESMPNSNMKQALECILDKRTIMPFNNQDIGYSNKKHMEDYMKKKRK